MAKLISYPVQMSREYYDMLTRHWSAQARALAEAEAAKQRELEDLAAKALADHAAEQPPPKLAGPFF